MLKSNPDIWVVVEYGITNKIGISERTTKMKSFGKSLMYNKLN